MWALLVMWCPLLGSFAQTTYIWRLKDACPRVTSGCTYYLAHSSGYKFYEISVLGNSNHIRYGKLSGAEESRVEAGDTFFPSPDAAVARAKTLIQEKLSHGYHIHTSQTEEVRTVDLSPVETGYVACVQGSRETVQGGSQVWSCDYANEETAVRAAKTEIREKLFFEKKAELARKRALAAIQVIDLDEEEDVRPQTPPRVVQIEEIPGKGRRRRKKKAVPSPPRTPAPMPKTPSETRLENLSDVLEGNPFAHIPVAIDDEMDIACASLTKPTTAPHSEPQPKPRKRPKLIPVELNAGMPEFIDLLLAQSWDSTMDPKGWLMSEKLDGVRSYWNGELLISRQGHPYLAPSFFTEGFPTDTSLDGELWVGRKQFQRCVSIVRRSDTDKHDFEEWKSVKYLVFDAPSLHKPFEERLTYIQSLAEKVASPYLSAHQHCSCDGIEHLNSELKRINDLGGEGLMLRQPGSLYECKRSRTLLKVKSFQDAEAVVIAHEPGHGKNEGLLGALRVRTSDGREFKVGTGFTDADRRNPPEVGAHITYKFQELTVAGIPRFPSFLRVHSDL